VFEGLATGFVVQGYRSEDWARLALELPAPSRLQLLCHLVFGASILFKCHVFSIEMDLLGEKTLVAFSDQDKIT
jgi:hypothetical protein